MQFQYVFPAMLNGATIKRKSQKYGVKFEYDDSCDEKKLQIAQVDETGKTIAYINLYADDLVAVDWEIVDEKEDETK